MTPAHCGEEMRWSELKKKFWCRVCGAYEGEAHVAIELPGDEGITLDVIPMGYNYEGFGGDGKVYHTLRLLIPVDSREFMELVIANRLLKATFRKP